MAINFDECFRCTRKPFRSEIGEKKICFLEKLLKRIIFFSKTYEVEKYVKYIEKTPEKKNMMPSNLSDDL